MTHEQIEKVCRELELALKEKMKSDDKAHEAAQAIQKAHKRLQMAKNELAMIDKNNEKVENEDMKVLEAVIEE